MQESKAITRKSASNLALAFILLPKAKREAMSALYAFCREVDDVADEDSVPVDLRRSELAGWREDVLKACNGGSPQKVVNQELQPWIQKYGLQFELFDELIKGVEMDLDVTRYATYEELDAYCYRVASVVGLLSIEIFGYKDPECRHYATALGKALQLTNIVRDVRGDAVRGRIYIPQEELKRCDVSEEEILQGRYSERFHRVAANVAARARKYYAEARAALPACDRKAMVAAELMGAVYGRLLEKLDRYQFNVFEEQSIRLSKGEKAGLILRTWWRFLM